MRTSRDPSGSSYYTETRQYNVLQQLTRLTVPGVLDHEYRFSATQNNGRITQRKDWVSGEEITYQYDSLNRLISAQTTGPEWGQSFGYDGFGNLLSQTVTKGNAPSLSISVDPATNRITTEGYSYDANGNLTAAPMLTMTYNVANQLVSATHSLNGTEEYAYDASGQRVLKQWHPCQGCTLSENYIYGVDGNLLRTHGNDDYNVYFGSKLIYRWDYYGSGASVLEDRLGSVVHRDNYYPQDSRYFPYGEEASASEENRPKFATYYRDNISSLDYAQNRYYSRMIGRFTSPDPYQASGGPADPQSWNRYAYVQNDPVNYYDPEGLCQCPAGALCSCLSLLRASSGGGFIGGFGTGHVSFATYVGEDRAPFVWPPPNKGGYFTDPATTGPTAWQYLTSIWGGCLDNFKRDAQRFDAAAFEGLLTGGMTWLDTRNSSIGQATVDSYAHNGDLRHLSDVLQNGRSAYTLPGTHYVAVGPDYFTNETQTQQVAIAIHEALHMHLINLPGSDIDPDRALGGWLMNFGFSPPKEGYSPSGQITDWIVGTKDLMSTIGGGCRCPPIQRTPSRGPRTR